MAKKPDNSYTQIFTPDWIIRYMVENSLGRLYLETHDDDPEIRKCMIYYLDEAKQEPEVQAQLERIRAETTAELGGRRFTKVKLMEPCAGNGRILVHMFDLLMLIYRRLGIDAADAVDYILEDNLYGTDIDDKCVTLSRFNLMMKARQYNHRLTIDGTMPEHIFYMTESNDIDPAIVDALGAGMEPETAERARAQLRTLLESGIDIKSVGIGSIWIPPDLDYELLKELILTAKHRGMSNDCALLV